MGRAIYSPASQKLGENLAKVRQEAGILQGDLAARIGVDQGAISKLERGHRRVTVLDLYAIARAMKMDPTTLFSKVIEGFPIDIEA